jgi:hypothetical protein
MKYSFITHMLVPNGTGQFTWTSNVASLSDARVQDDSAAFVYTPEGAWNTDLRNLPGFDDGNGQQVDVCAQLISIDPSSQYYFDAVHGHLHFLGAKPF